MRYLAGISVTKHSCVTTPSGSLCFCIISYIKILIHFPMQIKTYPLNVKIPKLVKKCFLSSAFIPFQSKVDSKLLPFQVQNMNSYNRKPCISFIVSTREFGVTSRKYPLVDASRQIILGDYSCQFAVWLTGDYEEL